MIKLKLIQGITGIKNGTNNLLLREISEQLKPKWLWFGVTDKCNSRCIYCNIWREKPTENVLAPDEIENILKDPLFKDVEYILNSGGEPTLRTDLKELILAEHGALPNARIQLSTNGLLPEIAIDTIKFAIQHNIDMDIGTSLDAIGENYDSIRGIRGNFKKVDKLLHELVSLRNEYGSKRINPTFGFTLTKQTLPFLEDVKLYAQNMDLDFLVQWYNQSTFYNNIGDDLSADEDRLMYEAVKSQPCSILREMWLRWLEGQSIKFQCFAMNTFCILKCNGDISPCLSLWDVKVGNVRENSPTEIWHSLEAKEARKKIKRCDGCLNSWGTSWSFSSSFYPYLKYYSKHPRMLMKTLGKRKQL